ncbi:MAG: enoyl-CoA hydratase-related protein [Polyangiaceae bacterium]|nr:enoyl-CoA hydratase-related protein [Polyangiaceae bacterium]
MNEVIVEKKGRTTVVTLNRPEARNALTRAVLSGITEAFTGAAEDRDVRAVVLTGSGGSFCAGADLRKTFSDDPDVMNHLGEYLDSFHAVIRAIVRCPKPTIASVDGPAVGFGADLAFACDLRVASTRAYLQEKFVNIGLMPDGGGTFWLPRLLGTARALKAIFLADELAAKELDALGLVVSVVPPEELGAATMALAQRLEAGPPLAYQHAKQSVYAGLGDFEAALRREREGQMVLLKSKDALEGIMAWSEKRSPNFRGE